MKIMAIINVTPDSFSDGGLHASKQAALAGARKMVASGADIIDVGGESTRPGAAPVSEQEELDRVIPVIEAIRGELAIEISVDSSRPQVMAAAVAAGAGLINDVRALQRPGALAMAGDLVASSGVRICLMHMQGQPATMQAEPSYDNVVQEVREFLLARVAACESEGIPKERLILDPGFGFGKTLDHNLQLLAHLDTLVATGLPVLVGLSRKSMIGAIVDKPVGERLHGSVAAALLAATKGASILRVHDVGPTVDTIRVWQALERGRWGRNGEPEPDDPGISRPAAEKNR